MDRRDWPWNGVLWEQEGECIVTWGTENLGRLLSPRGGNLRRLLGGKGSIWAELGNIQERNLSTA